MRIVFGLSRRGVVVRVFVLGILTIMSPFRTATAQSVEERLKESEKRVDELAAENAKLRNDLGIEGKAGMVVVKPAGKEPSLSAGGLLQAQFEAGDRGDGRYSGGDARLYLRRARVNVAGRFLEGFDFKAELDLAGFASNTSGLRAQLTDGMITWIPWAPDSLRIGQFKTPFGYEQLYRDPGLPFIERSLANDRLTVGRQLGIQVAARSSSARWTGWAGAFNGNGTNINFNDNNRMLYAGRATAVLREGHDAGVGRWVVGAAAFQTKDAAAPLGSEFQFDSTPSTPAADAVFNGDRWAWQVDSQFQLSRAEFWAEYIAERLEPDNGVPADRVDAAGGYLLAMVYLVERSLQGGVRYDTFDPNGDVSSNSTDSWTFGLNWYLKSHDVKVQLNYITSDVPNRDERQDKVLARLQTIF